MGKNDLSSDGTENKGFKSKNDKTTVNHREKDENRNKR